MQPETRTLKPETSKRSLSILLLIILALIWGSSFILMKRGLDVFSSNEVAALRMVIAMIVLIPLAVISRKQVDLKRNWKYLLVMGLFGNFIPAFLFTLAETGISSAVAGMLNALTPLFTLILGVFLFGSKTKWINGLGIIVGFAGAIVLFFANGAETKSSDIIFGSYLVLATFCYGISVNVIRKYLTGVPAIAATSWSFLLVAPLAIIILVQPHFTESLQKSGAATALGFVSILAIVGTAISVILFNVLVRITNALAASSVTYLIPIVAILWGLFDNEKILPLHYLGMAIILAGVYLVNKKSAIG